LCKRWCFIISWNILHMPSSEFEEIEFLVPSILGGGGGMLKSYLVCRGGGTFVDVDAQCILGSFNICGFDKYKNGFDIYHDMYSIVCWSVPSIGNPFNVSSRRLFQTSIHYACLVIQFSSCLPLMSNLCRWSRLLGSLGISCDNCNFTLSDWCDSTMAKQIKVVHDVHIVWSQYASTSIIEPKPS